MLVYGRGNAQHSYSKYVLQRGTRREFGKKKHNKKGVRDDSPFPHRSRGIMAPGKRLFDLILSKASATLRMHYFGQKPTFKDQIRKRFKTKAF